MSQSQNGISSRFSSRNSSQNFFYIELPPWLHLDNVVRVHEPNGGGILDLHHVNVAKGAESALVPWVVVLLVLIHEQLALGAPPYRLSPKVVRRVLGLNSIGY